MVSFYRLLTPFRKTYTALGTVYPLGVQPSINH
jgi:hypothetical protein